MAVSIRSCVMVCGMACWLFPAASEAQIGGLGRAITRGVTRKIETDAERLLRDGVRCVIDDIDCVSRAEREGKPVVLTNDQGEPLLDDEGRPITAPALEPEGAPNVKPETTGQPVYDLRAAPIGFAKAIESELTRSTPEAARHRDAAMVALSAYYGTGRQPLDVRSVHASAVHAARAYRSVEDIRRELGDQVHVAPVLTAISGLQYYVFDEGHRQVVAIRGTRPANIRNWVANLVVTGARDDIIGVDVHEGFLLATRVIQAGLMRRLDRHRPIHLTGHSLGGSLATLFALRLQSLGFMVSVTTFGAPKITTFAAFANEPRLHRLDLVRIVNVGDMVYHFPPTMDATGRRVYAQFGREWMLIADGSCVPTNLGSSLRKSAAMVMDDNLPDWSLEEHGMEIYEARLQSLVARGQGCQTEEAAAGQ